jgi:hypothetical protein
MPSTARLRGPSGPALASWVLNQSAERCAQIAEHHTAALGAGACRSLAHDQTLTPDAVTQPKQRLPLRVDRPSHVVLRHVGKLLVEGADRVCEVVRALQRWEQPALRDPIRAARQPREWDLVRLDSSADRRFGHVPQRCGSSDAEELARRAGSGHRELPAKAGNSLLHRGCRRRDSNPRQADHDSRLVWLHSAA